ncbi:MAG: hypothetical protein ABIW76_15605 [Fibrobacteria bacterium]
MQTAALEGVKKQGLEGLASMLSRQQEILASIAKEKGELRPFLDQWEGLPAVERGKLRAGRPGMILESLESVAQTIQARHQEMFGSDASTAIPSDPGAGTSGPGSLPPRGQGGQGGGNAPTAGNEADLSQRINIYRGLQ